MNPNERKRTEEWAKICPRCAKRVPEGAHTCTPSEFVQEQYKRIKELEAELAEARTNNSFIVAKLQSKLDEAKETIKEMNLHFEDRVKQRTEKLTKENERLQASDFWKDIIVKDKTLDVEQIKKEFEDYHYILEQLPNIYSHITGGLLSKHMYPAEVIKQKADEHYEKLYEEELEAKDSHLKLAVSVIEELLGSHYNLYKSNFGEDSDPEIDIVRKSATKALEEIRRDNDRK